MLYLVLSVVLFLFLLHRHNQRQSRIQDFKTKMSVFREGELTREQIDRLWDKHVNQKET